ncbi:MAG: ABC transporter substrate-binding protein, partial [Bradyrhizobium sp.]
MQKTQTFLGAVLCTIAAVGPSWGQSQKDIVIGAALVVSGPFASYGTDAKSGIDLAVKQINKAGGVLGKTFRVVYDDTGGDRAKAVAIYRKYAAQPDIIAAMSISSPEFVALDPASNEAKLPFFAIGATVPVPKFSPYSFRTNLVLSNSVGKILPQLKEKGLQNVAILYDNGANFAVAEMEIVKAGAVKAGMPVLGVEAFTTGDQNFTLQLTRIAAQKPDLLWVAGTTDEVTLIITQCRALGINAKIIGGGGMNDPRIGALGSAAEGVMTFALFNGNDTRPAVVKFIEDFRRENNGQFPPPYSALGYDAMQLVADGVRRAGSTDREALRNALGTTESFEGVNGP